jgi:hypothetical protein
LTVTGNIVNTGATRSQRALTTAERLR